MNTPPLAHAEPRDVAAYTAAVAHELAALAERHRMPMLGHLLRMAEVQALEDAEGAG